MAFPPQDRESYPRLPSTLLSGPRCYKLNREMQSSGSPAISTPGLNSKDVTPLPPPRHLPFLESYAHPEEPIKDLQDYGRSSLSIYNGQVRMHSGSVVDDSPAYKRGETGGNINCGEGCKNYTTTDFFLKSGPTKFLLHNRPHFQTAASLHGDSMKKKLDPIRRFDRSLRSVGSSAPGERARPQPGSRSPIPNMPVQPPIHGRSPFKSPAKMTGTRVLCGTFPRSAAFKISRGEHNITRDRLDYGCLSKGLSWNRNSDETSSTRSTYELTSVKYMDVDKVASAKRLQPDKADVLIGHKRRAASPPAGDDLPHGDLTQRDLSDARQRDLGSRSSSLLRLTVAPQASSSAFMPSAAASSFNSYNHIMPIAPSSANTTTPLTRRSPVALSPVGAWPASGNSLYTTPASLDHNSLNSISGKRGRNARIVPGPSLRKAANVQKPTGSKVQRAFMCGYCPKRMQRFGTAEELKTHEPDKQYGCLFCGNRFKNKNEAERHQNSLHVRRQSWSCSNILDYDRAFHDSPSRPGEADTCGYCGDEFPRSGRGLSYGSWTGRIVPQHATYKDWDDRIRHLQKVHKFRECSLSKKFYRAGHFRQHLKLSHAGTSGKWTKMLENECMVNEDRTELRN